MKPALLFLAKFVALTAPLVWLWRAGGLSAYHALFAPLASAIYGWLGCEGIATPARDRYINFVPFLTLMLLTPGLRARRRIGGIALGLALLFALHVAVNATADRDTQRLSALASLILDAAPFALWIALAREFARGLLPRRRADATPSHSARSADA
jgi:hypothetical protein